MKSKDTTIVSLALQVIDLNNKVNALTNNFMQLVQSYNQFFEDSRKRDIELTSRIDTFMRTTAQKSMQKLEDTQEFDS